MEHLFEVVVDLTEPGDDGALLGGDAADDFGVDSDDLDLVVPDTPDVVFINVEPYQLEFKDGSLQPVTSSDNALVPVEATLAFKLQTEPYVFVVGSDGKIAASFELVFSPDEIESAIKSVEQG